MPSSDGPRGDDPDERTDAAPDAAATPETGSGGAEAGVGRRKVLLVSAAAVVVLAVAGLVVYLLTTGDDPVTDTAGPDVPSIAGSAPPATTISSQPAGSTPPLAPSSSSAAGAAAPAGEDAVAAEDVAEQAANAISSADVSTLAELSCDPSSVGTEETFPDNATAEVVGEPQVDGDTATVDIRLTIEGAEPATVPIPLTKQDGRWCIP